MIARLCAAVLLTATLASCDNVQQVAQVADKASICADAIRLSGFVPDVKNPRQAAEDAKRAADELRRLAGEAPDEALRDALDDMAKKLSELNPGNINPNDVAKWVSGRVSAAENLANACG